MKTKYYVSLLLAGAMLSACENPEVSFTTDSVEMHAGEELKLDVDASDPIGHWTSSDDFVASVYNGYVTAKHIGEATISVRNYYSDQYSASCVVKVLPLYHLYTEPLCDWGKGKQESVVKRQKLDSISPTVWQSTDEHGVRTEYNFNKEETLTEVRVLIGTMFTRSDIVAFLTERYTYKQRYDWYLDNDYESAAKTRVTIDGEEELQIIYESAK